MFSQDTNLTLMQKKKWFLPRPERPSAVLALVHSSGEQEAAPNGPVPPEYQGQNGERDSLSKQSFDMSSLTTNELHYVLTRRLRNLTLPDDMHTNFAETASSVMTNTLALLAKLHLLQLAPVRNFLEQHRKANVVLQVFALSQLHPFRILQIPLLRMMRPLHWILAPFVSMSVPVALTISFHFAMSVFEALIPAPLRHILEWRRARKTKSDHFHHHHLTPQVVQTAVNTFSDAHDKAVQRIRKVRNHLGKLPPIPALLTHRAIAPLLEGDRHSELLEQEPIANEEHRRIDTSFMESNLTSEGS